MLSFVLALAAAAQADGATGARQAYATCLRETRTASVNRNIAPDAFGQEAATRCAGQATAFETALVRRDTGAGVNRTQATADARSILSDMRDNAVEYYRDEYAAAHPAEPAAAPAGAPAPTPEPAATPQ